MDSLALVMTTVARESDATFIARSLVDRRLAACVSVLGGVVSTYRWKGTVSDDKEILLLIKTPSSRLEELKRELASIHPYEVPEIVAMDVTDVSEPYMNWLVESTGGEG